MKEQLTEEQKAAAAEQFEKDVQAKAEALSASRGKRVHAIIVSIPDSDDKIVGYLDEPSRQAKMASFDELATSGSVMSAGEMILKSSIIKEESDPRIYSDASENDAIYLGACLKCNSLAKAYAAEIKKK